MPKGTAQIQESNEGEDATQENPPRSVGHVGTGCGLFGVCEWDETYPEKSSCSVVGWGAGNKSRGLRAACLPSC